MMNYEWRKALDAMRKDGYAVVVFSPKELNGMDPLLVARAMFNKGWSTILNPEEQNNGN